jgi:hypothetical protein
MICESAPFWGLNTNGGSIFNSLYLMVGIVLSNRLIEPPSVVLQVMFNSLYLMVGIVLSNRLIEPPSVVLQVMFNSLYLFPTTIMSYRKQVCQVAAPIYFVFNRIAYIWMPNELTVGIF